MTICTIVPDESTEADAHAVLALLNDLTQGLGMATFPYSRTATGPRLNLPALKEMLTYAVELLNSDAEEEKPDPDEVYKPQSGSNASGGWISVPTVGPRIPTPMYPAASGAAVGPQNTRMLRTIAKYAGWAEDLLSGDMDPVLTRHVCLEAIGQYIAAYGYNPANFYFRVRLDSVRQLISVEETAQGVAASFSASSIASYALQPVVSPFLPTLTPAQVSLNKKREKDWEKANRAKEREAKKRAKIQL